MAQSPPYLSLHSLLHPRLYPALVSALCDRAPASVLTLSSVLISYLVNAAILDYRLYSAIGEGGLGKPSIFKWLLHTIVLRPLSMSRAASIDATYIPPDDSQWTERVREAEATQGLDKLPRRSRRRPAVFGLVPHRQIEDTEKQGSERQKEIIAHLGSLAQHHSSGIQLALSSYEATTSPCLFVSHSQASSARPTDLARLYLSGNPAPKKTMAGEACQQQDKDLHEVVHIHLTEGSLHVVLSPQDARMVVKRGWGQLHQLAGLFYRGHYFPPYWLPSWIYDRLGGQSRLRWSYLQGTSASRSAKAVLIPPTYCMLYAPNTPEQTEWVKAIIDSSVMYALGQPRLSES